MRPEDSPDPAFSTQRPLPALLSQVLAAFTVELDNQFEQQMAEAGCRGARLSLVVWANLMRFVREDPVSVRDLAAQALAPINRIKFELGCLERWGFLIVDPSNSIERRDGWGSGRGIRASSTIHLTTTGLAASRIWPPLFDQIEQRWEARFSKAEIGRLREVLEDITGRFEMELPEGLPANLESNAKYPPKGARKASTLSLPALLSQTLLVFRLAFDRESPTTLDLCANTIRVLGEQPIRAAELPLLTGGSPETTDIGWQLKPYVIVEPDPNAARGKVIRLSPRGVAAQRTYHRLVAAIEHRWQDRFGKPQIRRLRESLEALFERNGPHGPPRLAEGLLAPPGTARAGYQTPALGRRDIGAAARQRMRDLVSQNEAFLRDPAVALPHYPLWDMNRGFGP